jgi:predicted glycoside hydrolase/deacetylase ChbG (UPF0249 family)
VFGKAAAAAAALAAKRPRLGLGLHIDLGEWMWDGQSWCTVYQRVPTEDTAAVAREIERQVREFRRLVGRDPSHLDSHQNVHLEEPVRSVVLGTARGIEIPVRACTPGVRHVGAFHGRTGTGERLPGKVGVEALLRIVAGVRAGITEIGCHPGSEPGDERGYSAERVVEAHTLCTQRVRSFIDRRRITLCNFDHPEVRQWVSLRTA